MSEARPDVDEPSPTVLAGPTVYGAYMDPPHALGLELEGLEGPELVQAISAEGTTVAWEMTLDGRTLSITHAGGVFVEFPQRPAPADPVAEIDAHRQEAIDLANLVLCNLALSSSAYASSFTIVDLASALRDGDRIEVWAAPMPFAPAAFRVQAAVAEGDDELTRWRQIPRDKLQLLDELQVAVALRAIAPNLPAFVAAAHGNAVRARQAECLLFSWMACEQLLSHLWETHVASGGVDRAHRERLRDGRTFSAAVQAEALRLMGHLSAETYAVVSAARKQRNDLAHNATLQSTAIDVALDALYGILNATLNGGGDG